MLMRYKSARLCLPGDTCVMLSNTAMTNMESSNVLFSSNHFRGSTAYVNASGNEYFLSNAPTPSSSMSLSWFI